MTPGGLSLTELRAAAAASLRAAVTATRDAKNLMDVAERDELLVRLAEMQALHERWRA